MRLARSLAAALAAVAIVAALPAHAVTLKWGAQNDILTLDPHSQNHATTSAILQHTYEGLTRYTRTYGVEPSLATAWQQISATQLRFTLRKGVRFHDGSPFTADDVVFSYERIMQPQGTMQVYVSGVKEVKKVDDFTVDHDETGLTRLSGFVRDTSHLHGLVAYLASINAELISITPVTPTPDTRSTS